MLFIINFIRGFLIVEVTGYSIIRFINLCSSNNIIIENVTKKDNVITLKCKIKDFYKMHKLARKCGARIRISKKYGLPFVSFRYRHRKILFTGIVFFIAFSYYLSSFIWYIDIQGNGDISKIELIERLRKYEITIGTKKENVDPHALEEQLLRDYPIINWVNVHKNGTTLELDMSLGLRSETIEEKEEPTNIIATKEGVIVSATTSRGKQLVEVGDYVKKGDLLVSGELILTTSLGEEIKRYVNSKSDIYARIEKPYHFDIENNYIEKVYTGKKKVDYKIYFFGRVYNIFGKEKIYDNYIKHTSRKQLKLSEKYYLPIMLIIDTYKQVELVEKKKTESQIKDEYNQKINDFITINYNTDVDILKKEVHIKKTSQNTEIYSIITVIENISENIKIDIRENVDGTEQTND